MKIADRSIGPGHPVFIVAELSCAHGGKLENAHRLIDAAVDAGADAVKLQTYRPQDMTLDSDHPAFRLQSGPWVGKRLWDLYTEAQTPWEWHAELFAHARDRDVIAFSAPFSPEAVAFLETLDCPAYKIASPENEWHSLARAIVVTGKPIIMSNGLSRRRWWLDDSWSRAAVLHCVSGYPTPLNEVDLMAMRRAATVPVFGLSDHTAGIEAAPLAVALGASIVEKHLRLPDVSTPEDGHAMLPYMFRHMVQRIREAEQMLQPCPSPESEQPSQGFRRRLILHRAVKQGEPVTADCVSVLRAGEGLLAHRLSELPKVAMRDLVPGIPLYEEDIS